MRFLRRVAERSLRDRVSSSDRYTVLVLPDLSSAFDTADYQISLERLRDLIGLSGSVLHCFPLTSLVGVSWLTTSCLSQQTDCAVFPRALLWGHSCFCYNLLEGFNNVSFFADDIQLYCSFKPSQTLKLDSLMNCLMQRKQSLHKNSLQLNSEKTETLVIVPDNDIEILISLLLHIVGLTSSLTLDQLYAKLKVKEFSALKWYVGWYGIRGILKGNVKICTK
uniref:Reverse transcriptase domain-containing protein n=1 Tax=Oryzias melastigma TaxID=30732 RepID=A0A3B3D370_ORYME